VIELAELIRDAPLVKREAFLGTEVSVFDLSDPHERVDAFQRLLSLSQGARDAAGVIVDRLEA